MRVITKAPPHEIELFVPPPDAIYTIEATSHLVDVPRRKIMVYCKHRLVVPVINARDRGYSFDREGIRALRRIEALRSICGNDLAGIKIILELTNALERLHSEMRSLSQNNSAGKARITSSPNVELKTNKRRKKNERN